MSAPARQVEPVPPCTGYGCHDAHSRPASEVLVLLKANADYGLTAAEADRRQTECGPNEIQAGPRRSLPAIVLHQFQSTVVYLLMAAGAMSLLLHDYIEATAIAVVLTLNGAIGFAIEWKALRSMAALRNLVVPHCVVRRDAKRIQIRTRELVPGDIVLLTAGDAVPADLRILDSAALQVNESALTGESVPVEKSAANVPQDCPPAERLSMLHGGTHVTRGQAVA
ncbi:MAG: HAD-IC family P-type ATPase, partial [Phycisphaerae bacterium]